MTFRTVFLLPPLPRLIDWWMAGACAGLLLGLAELGVAFVDGTEFSTQLAILLLATSALLVSTLSGGLGSVLRGAGLRLSSSQLVGAVLGPLGLVVLLRPVWGWMLIGEAPESLDLIQLGAAAVTIALAAVGAARLGERGERTGTAASGPLVWGCAALLLALASRLAAGDAFYSFSSVAALAAGVVGLAFSGLAFYEIGRRRGMRPRASFGQSLTVTAVGAAALCYAPGAIPWLLYGHELAVIPPGPPNILVAALGANGSVQIPGTGRIGEGAEAPNLGMLAWNGIAYADLVQHWVSGAAAALSLPDGTTLPRRLEVSGYAVGAIHRSPEAAQDLALGIEQVDARPGPARALRESGEWLSAAPLLLGPGSAVLEAAGLNRTERSTEDVAARAMGWLLNWRTQRAENPFFLLVDLRNANGEQDLAGADSALASILEQLNMLEADANTLVLVTLEGASGVAGRRDMAAVIRPPLSWALPGAGTRAEGKILARDIASALAQTAEGDGAKAVPLPGVSFDPVEPVPETLPTYESEFERWLEANPLPELPRLAQ